MDKMNKKTLNPPKQNQNSLETICHPYLFALKEGKQIQDDLMDYSLLLLQRNCSEVIRSPSLAADRLKMLSNLFQPRSNPWV